MTLASAALLVLGATASAQPADTGRPAPAPAGKLWIEGGSNIRDWTCKAATFEAHIDLDSLQGRADDSPLSAEHVRRVSVKVGVRNLKCGNRRMESDLYRALKADDPSTPSNIVGVFDAPRAAQKGESHVDTEGTIAVAGVEKCVQLRITIDRLADGMVVARGSLPLRMTDFGVTPPTGLFGLIRSHDELVVEFEVAVPMRGPVVIGGR